MEDPQRRAIGARGYEKLDTDAGRERAVRRSDAGIVWRLRGENAAKLYRGDDSNIAHVAYGSPSAAANTCAYDIAESFFNRLNEADTSCIRSVPQPASSSNDGAAGIGRRPGLSSRPAKSGLS